MSFGKADPPQPPNPTATAAAQTGTNVSTALANQRINEVNQVTPTGSLTYSYDPSNDFTFVDPTSGFTYNIPGRQVTQTLSPAQQAIQNSTQSAQGNLANLAAEQSANIRGILSQPIDLSNAPGPADISRLLGLGQAAQGFGDVGTQRTDLGNFGFQQAGFDQTGPITQSYGPQDSFSADRDRIQQQMFERLQPQLDLQQEQLRQNLADQGIRYGSPAYTAAMDNYNRQLNDLRLGVSGQAGTEQQRLSQMAQAQAQFQNAAQQQAYQEALGRGQFANAAQQQAYQQALGANTFANQAQAASYQQALGRANFANAGLMQQAQLEQARVNAEQAARANYLQEQYAYRQEPINEISALLGQSQVSRPNFITAPQTSIPTTDIAGLINQNFQQQFGNFQAQNQQQQQLLGGLLGLGGNLALAGALSDRRIKENITKMGSVFAASDEGERKELPIYSYSFKADPLSRRHVGPMAQDVEKIRPDAVGETLRGVKYIRPHMVMGSIMRAA